ncbi:hypothetical protein GMST_42030 [Geomonas silvestris]|uniref:Uncharacterized protein n=1 Tax=Geomonas silvestris TaxID=2740184 RepID=A0A6V8MPA4_9BACT|nr:hypothetical protein [Geomonas silvestris]GFO61878.1 hypothetical protein GMST_42030 [Geomonas silvestris]
MNELKFDTTGPEVKFLAKAKVFLDTVFTLKVFKEDWREDKLGSRDVLQTARDWYQQTFERGLTGNRYDIAARNEARKTLGAHIQKILYYVAIIAEESDIQVLLASGVVTKKSKVRVRKTVKLAPAA